MLMTINTSRYDDFFLRMLHLHVHACMLFWWFVLGGYASEMVGDSGCSVLMVVSLLWIIVASVLVLWSAKLLSSGLLTTYVYNCMYRVHVHDMYMYMHTPRY